MTMRIEHPEEALDRISNGTASAQDKAAVNEHVATCRVCALQLRVAGAKEVPGTARAAFDARQNDRVVSLAIQKVGRKKPALVALARRPRVLFAAACLLLMAGAAGAAWMVRDAHRPSSPPGLVGSAAPAVSSLPLRTAAAVEIVPPPMPLPAAPESAVAERAAVKPPPAEPTASALFEQGTALRAQNKRAAAILVFEKLQRAYPESRESRLSYALVGTLLLEQRRPAEALAQFDRHLAVRGAADQEALAGRASAYQQMGRGADEAKAWRRLLAAHPDSIYATRATQRLAALAARP